MHGRRRLLIAGGLAWLAPVMVPVMARAHHGWAWAEDEDFSLAGVLRAARLGNPHGELDVDGPGGLWTCEIGQPWRNESAGLTEDLLVPGTELTLEGHRSRDPEARLMKAERVILGGRVHDLYPDRS